MHVKGFVTKCTNKESFGWDTYGLPFVVDHSATAIICNARKVFIGKLIPTKIMLETPEGMSVSTKLVGIIRVVLTDDKKDHHTYNIPGCIYDPDPPISIFGIPALGQFFSDGGNINNPLDDDGTTVKSGATKSHFVWDHGRRKRHFMHGDNHMPELYSYVGHGYFNAFCTRIHKLVGDKVHYALFSALSIDPHIKQKDNLPTKPAIISYDNGELDDEETLQEWYNPASNESGSTNINSGNTDPTPIKEVMWADTSKPSADTSSENKEYFQLGMDLFYRDRAGRNISSVYEEDSTNGLKHTIHLEDGARLDTNNSNLQLLY